MTKDWSEPQAYEMLTSGDEPSMIAFVGENDDTYRIRIENAKTGNMMFIDLSPKQALDLVSRMIVFYKRVKDR